MHLDRALREKVSDLCPPSSLLYSLGCKVYASSNVFYSISDLWLCCMVCTTLPGSVEFGLIGLQLTYPSEVVSHDLRTVNSVIYRAPIFRQLLLAYDQMSSKQCRS